MFFPHAVQPQTLNSCLVAFFLFRLETTGDHSAQLFPKHLWHVWKVFRDHELKCMNSLCVLPRVGSEPPGKWRETHLLGNSAEDETDSETALVSKVRFSVSVLYVVGLFLPQSFIWLGIKRTSGMDYFYGDFFFYRHFFQLDSHTDGFMNNF